MYISTGLQILKHALSIVDQGLKMFPDYSERKRKQYYELREALYEELNKPFEKVDDNKLGDLIYELQSFAESFANEIGEKSSSE